MIDEIEQIQTLLRTGDSFAAIEHIQRIGDPHEIAARYQSLVHDLYWKAHDLSALVAIGRAGILYCLTTQLRSIAKGLAYDIGSFTWPGWEEPGIRPTPDEIAFGSECASLNLRLAIELNKPPVRISMAHWLIGAHALAAGDLENSETEFQLAQNVFASNDDESKSVEPCNMGYLAITRLCRNPSDAAARASFEAIVAQLAARTDEDAKAYLAQLLTARRRFAPDSQIAPD